MRHGLAPGVDPRAHIFPVNDVFECADGRRLALGILEEHFWQNFVRCVAHLAPGLAAAEYASDAARRANGDALAERLAALFRQKNAAEWVALLEANDVPVDLCRTPAEAAELPQLCERGDVVEVHGERFALFPVWADGRRGGTIGRAPPAAGEHSRELLVELGFDEAAIAALAAAGAVKAG